jgi:ubiquinone/menaquinone biosynthesis C-methylase UbiE
MSLFRRKRTRSYTVVGPAVRRRNILGRRYAANAPYLLPNDDREVNRLDFQHYMLRYALRGNYVAPLHRPTGILDVGCGTGRWALEMARQFPGSAVVGVDMVPPPVDEAAERGRDARPENYAFVQANVLEGLPFADASFDYVHQRLLFLAIPTARWPGLISQLMRVARPGGYVELVEGSAVPADSGPAMQMWGQWMSVASARRGIDFAQGSQVGESLRQAGLRDVNTYQVRMQAGRQFGRLGAMLEANYMGLMQAVKPQVVAAGITTAESYDAAVQAIRAEIADGHCSWYALLAYGQRPR